MTIEEAIKALSLMEHVESIAAAYDPGERRQDTTVRELKEACRMASEAFRAQQVHTKMDRSQLHCNKQENGQSRKKLLPILRPPPHRGSLGGTGEEDKRWIKKYWM